MKTSESHSVQILQTPKFEKWLDELRDLRAKLIVTRRLARMREGHFGDWKNLGDGIFELRIMYGRGYRVYCMRKGATIVIILAGGHKDSQSRDITQAKLLSLASESWIDDEINGI